MSGTHEPTDRSHSDAEQPSTGAGTPLSRRRFVRASAATAAGLAGLGAGTPATAQSVVEEECNYSDEGYEQIEIAGGDFVVMNNKWGNPNAEQCIYLYDDQTYGWSFSGGDGNINYPEVFIGQRPWGDNTGVPEFEGLTRGEVEELTMSWDVDLDVDGTYNLTEEWWLMDGGTDPDGATITHEIMLVCSWGGGHDDDHSPFVEEGVWTDDFGNTIDYWTQTTGGSGDEFHIFGISEPSPSGQVDLKRIVDYLTEHEGISEDLQLSGIEFGTETFGGPTGDVHFQHFDVTINGATYQSVPGTDLGPQPPTSPDDQWTNEVTDSSIEMGWSSVDEAEWYNVSLDGTEVDDTASTTYTFDGLDPDTQYTVGVQSENADGTSDTETLTVRTDEEEDDGPCADVESMEVDGDTVCNVDGDAYYRDVNGDGSVGNRDVGAFFERFHFDAFDRDEFDYSGNGRVSHGDVVALFDSVV